MEDQDTDQKTRNELNLDIGELDDQHQAFYLHAVDQGFCSPQGEVHLPAGAEREHDICGSRYRAQAE
jgi:hypothetical protein